MQTTSNSCCNTFGRLYFATCKDTNGLELELDSTCSGLRAYINVFSLPLIEDEEGSQRSKFSISICGLEESYLGTLLEGKQRMLLPPDATLWVIEALTNGFDVHLRAGRYSATILSEGFADKYCKLASEI